MNPQPAWAGGKFKLLQASLQGKPAVIVAREDLDKSEAPRFPWLVTLRLPTRGADAKGLCSEAESDRLVEVEESILAHLDPATFRYLGRMTWNGEREVWLYAADPRQAAAGLAQGIRTAGAEGAEAETDSDPSWAQFARFA